MWRTAGGPRTRGVRLWLLCVLLLFQPQPAAAQPASLLLPSALAYDAAGDLFLVDTGRHQVFEATLAGSLVLVAGTGTQGYTGDGGPATAAELNRPGGIAVGGDGTIYIADTGNARIRAISGGTITTLAGTGLHTFGGDGLRPVLASFRAPTALALDAAGGLLLCDSADGRVRRIGLGAGGLVRTVAGTGVQGFAGDGGPALAAELDAPAALALAADGRLFLADTHNQRVRVLSPAGVITTYAGNGQRGSAGDGGAATAAQLADPRGLAVTADGTLFVSDADNRRVRQVSPTGTISTVAGSGTEGESADGATALPASLGPIRGIALSPFGLPAFADARNGTVRVIVSGKTLFQPAALASGRPASTVQGVLSSAQNASQIYGPVNASVTVQGPVGTAQGLVVLSEGASILTGGTLSGGQTAVTAAPLPVGTHSLTIAYGGDGLNAAAQAVLATLKVTPLAITATAADAAAVYGAALPPLTGTLQGVLPQDVSQVTAIFSSGVGALSPVGTYPLKATLTGPKSANYTVSMAPNSGMLQIGAAPSRTTLGSVALGYAGLPLRLTASVTPGTSGQPTGTVRFLDGGALIATAMLVNGSASAVYLSPASGAHSLVAAYGGDADFLASASALQAATVGALPDFNLSLSGAGTVTVLAGATATYSLLVAAQPAPFTGDVTLALAGLPTGATATFSPVQVVPGVSSALVTLTVQVPAAQAMLRVRQAPAVSLGCFLLIGGFFFRRAGRSRAFVTLSVGLLVIVGCGARTVGDAGEALSSKSYPLQITGTSTNLLGVVVTHTAGATLVVQQ